MRWILNDDQKKAGSFRAGRSSLLEELLEVIEIDCCDESLLMEVKSSQITNLAGAEGIEPSSKVLETSVLPLNHAPRRVVHYSPRAILLTRDMSTLPSKLALKYFMTLGMLLSARPA
jgi:hypothetical protein